MAVTSVRKAISPWNRFVAVGLTCWTFAQFAHGATRVSIVAFTFGVAALRIERSGRRCRTPAVSRRRSDRDLGGEDGPWSSPAAHDLGRGEECEHPDERQRHASDRGRASLGSDRSRARSPIGSTRSDHELKFARPR